MPLNKHLEPESFSDWNGTHDLQESIAISLKRIADALDINTKNSLSDQIVGGMHDALQDAVHKFKTD